jgi:hypothetical protein
MLLCLRLFELDEDTFLVQIVTCDEMWVHYFTPESKRSSVGWCQEGSPLPKKFRTRLSVSNVTASMFWYSIGVSHLYFLPHGVTING